MNAILNLIFLDLMLNDSCATGKGGDDGDWSRKGLALLLLLAHSLPTTMAFSLFITNKKKECTCIEFCGVVRVRRKYLNRYVAFLGDDDVKLT